MGVVKNDIRIDGAKLAAAMKERHVNKERAALACGYKKGYIYRLIYNERISKDLVEQLRRKFGIEPESYLAEEELKRTRYRLTSLLPPEDYNFLRDEAKRQGISAGALVALLVSRERRRGRCC